MMLVALEYAKKIKRINKDDKIVPYRNIDDMKFGTLTIEENGTYFDILGAVKKKDTRLIKFCTVYYNDAHTVVAAVVMALPLLFSSLIVFGALSAL